MANVSARLLHLFLLSLIGPVLLHGLPIRRDETSPDMIHRSLIFDVDFFGWIESILCFVFPWTPFLSCEEEQCDATAVLDDPFTFANGCTIPQLTGCWEKTTSYPIPAAEAQGGIIGNDLVVVSGFSGVFEVATPRTYAIDLNDPEAKWRRMDDMPVSEGITHAATVVVGSDMYMCGGYLGGHPGPHVATCLVYHHSVPPGNDEQWETFTSLPEGRAGGGMVYIEDTNNLVFSGGAERPVEGVPDAVDYQHTWKYSFDTLEWTEMEDIPFLSNHMSYVSAQDETGSTHHFFVAGQVGENEFTGNVDKNFEWDVVNEDWIERQDMPFTRGHASSSTRAISCGYIIAGGSSNEFGQTEDISYYDIPSDSWTSIGELPRALNTPVCDIDFVNGYLYCETGIVGSRFSYRRPIRF